MEEDEEEKEKEEKEDPSLHSVVKLLKNLSVKVDSKFDEVQASLLSVRNDMTVLKENMITQEIFQKLEVRDEKLEGLVESRIQEPSSFFFSSKNLKLYFDSEYLRHIFHQFVSYSRNSFEIYYSI